MNRAVVIRAAAGLVAYLKAEGDAGPRPARRRSASTPATTPTSSPATPRRSSSPPAGARCSCPDRCRRRCSRSRSGISAPTRASWSRRATTRRRTTGTRSTSATAARSCRRPTRRSPPTSPPWRRWRALPSPPTAGRPSARTWSQDATSTRSSPSSLPTSPRDLPLRAHRLHGVGHGTVRGGVRPGGVRSTHPGRRASGPGPDFPTVAFPNPEETGAIDLALDLAASSALRPRHRQRSRRRPMRGSRARRRPRRLADAAR